MFDETYDFELCAKFNYKTRFFNPYFGFGIGYEKYSRDVFYSSGISSVESFRDLSEKSLYGSFVMGMKINIVNYLYPFFEFNYMRFNYDSVHTIMANEGNIRNKQYIIKFGISFLIKK